MDQHVAPIACKPWTLNGLGDQLVVGHYENHYGNAVRSLNAIRDRLASLDLATAPDYEVRALKREELAASGSVALHELYFASLGGDGAVLFTGTGTGSAMPHVMSAALEQQFGSLSAWRREFVALAQALGGGSGWAVLSYSRRDGQLHNQLALDDCQMMADAVPLLVLDMYEHAYQPEFGANAVAYVHAFMRNVDWSVVAQRFVQGAGGPPQSQVPVVALPQSQSNAQNDVIPSISPEELALAQARGEPLQVIDARPRFHFSRSPYMMAEAVYRDPERVHEWAAELVADTPVVVYCSYGFNVGCAVTATLRERGFDARFLRGGLSGWYAAGGARAVRQDTPA
ncbi:MAG: superoxide dismutase [Chloroflexi bacterium]|nr:MAG: superoxide dismutase [Chloroflexota bacterium]